MPFAGKNPDPNPRMPFIVSFRFLIRAREITVLYNLRLGIKIYSAQSSVSNLQAFDDFVQLVTPFLSNSLKALVTGTVTMVFHLSHQYFNILFSTCLSTMYFLLLPALHLGVMRKSFLFFKEALLIIVHACAQHIPYNWMKVGGMRRSAISFPRA